MEQSWSTEPATAGRKSDCYREVICVASWKVSAQSLKIAKIDSEAQAAEILARNEPEHPVGALYQGGAFTHVEAVPNPAPLPK